MKKNILSLLAVVSFGLAVSAQTFEIYEGTDLTNNIANTELTKSITNDFFETHFYVKNISGAPIKTRIQRKNILTTSENITYGICWGAVGSGGLCTSSEDPIYTFPEDIELNSTNMGELTSEVLYAQNSNEPVHFRYYILDENNVKYDSLDVIVLTTLGVKELKNTVSFNAYPNPANDVINLSVQGSTDNSMKIIDVLGNVIVEEKFGTSKKLDVSQFKNGVYILTIYSNGKMVQTKRVVVRH